MYIEVGKTYRTHNGKRAFYIIGKKTISPTGFHYIGECIKTGLVVYFNRDGHHSHQSELWLEVDTSKFMPINGDGTFATANFVKREEIPSGRFIGFLHMVNGSYQSISFVDKVK